MPCPCGQPRSRRPTSGVRHARQRLGMVRGLVWSISERSRHGPVRSRHRQPRLPHGAGRVVAIWRRRLLPVRLPQLQRSVVPLQLLRFSLCQDSSLTFALWLPYPLLLPGPYHPPSGVLLVGPHLAAVEAAAPAADDGCIGRAVGAEAGALQDQTAPVLAAVFQVPVAARTATSARGASMEGRRSRAAPAKGTTCQNPRPHPELHHCESG